MTERDGGRLLALDALRGLAAMAVVLFHCTTRFEELYPTSSLPLVSFPNGHYGVNLFFIISGFVIFMTLERTTRPMDFVVSRFSRLFPAYWCAIALTFAITHALGLPGKLVGAGTALANTVMLHGLFRVPHVDGVYWTLEVELLFYIAMFSLYRFGRLGQIHAALAIGLALRWLYYVAAQAFGVDLPWTVYRLLFLEYLPWFALGIAIYTGTVARAPAARRAPWLTAWFALATLAVTDSLFKGALALVLALLVLLAATGRARMLQWRPLVWLGSISYPLYLLHENIGWSLLLQLRAQAMPIDLAIVVTLGAVLALSHVVSRTVERPAMHAIRTRYKAWRDASPPQASGLS